MRFLLLALVSTVVASAQLPVLVIPHFADGGGWKSMVNIFNSSGLGARVQVTFRAGDGSRIAVPIQGYGVVSVVDVDLPPSNSAYLETTGASLNTQIGWVRVEQVAGTAPVSGFVVFRSIVPGRPDFEAVSNGMRPVGSIVFPFDNTKGLVTSFAMVNLSPAGCAVDVAPIFDESGTAVRTAEPRMVGFLAPNGHSAFVATDFVPELANKRGYLVFTPQLICGSGGIAMVGLRFNPSGPFTNLLPIGTSPLAPLTQ